MTRRKLKPEELDLWRTVAKTATALHRRHPMPADLHAPKAKRKTEAAPLQMKLDGRSPPKPAARKVSYDLAPALSERMHKVPVQMDKKTFARMNRGKLQPDGRIDLHGMTLDRAHAALVGFVLSAHGEGKRLLLVITGKGKDRDEGGPIPVRFGVLRHQVPQWLATQPLASVVLQVTQAHVNHGGGGAYYVYLRRRR